MKKIVCFLGTSILFVALIFVQKAFSNAAQLGVWNAGGTIFTMLYPEDSITFRKVQMQEERIYIQLYKGYAVVKGIYQFRNTTSETLKFKMGYPANGVYSGGSIDLNEVVLDSLSRFKVKVKGNWLPLLKETGEEYGSISVFSKNWMVWQMAFAPYDKQTVEVYFLVNTNNAHVKKGYNAEYKNAFIYLLESGSIWHQPIEKGDFYIQLMNSLKTESIDGLSSGVRFQYNNTYKIFRGTRSNFSPTPKDNIVITYYQHDDNFLFEKIIPQSDSLFAVIDKLCIFPLEILTYAEAETVSPYNVKCNFWGNFSALLMLFVICAPFIIATIVIVITVWAITKWLRIKRKKNRGGLL